MEPIRPPFYVGLVMLGAGVLMFILWWIIPEQPQDPARFFHGLLFWIATLSMSLGVFLASCIGLVFLVSYMVRPSLKKST